MKSVTLRLSLAAALALGAVSGVSAEVTERLDDRASFKTGEEAWNKVCARCHTVAGEGHEFSVGPDLSINEYDVETMRHFVRNGYLAMPSFPKSTLDDASLEALSDYVAKNIYKGEAQ